MSDSSRQIALQELQEGIAELSTLSKVEYGAVIEDVATTAQLDENERILRVGRLLGILVKQPFSHSQRVDPKTSQSGAARAWKLDEKLLANLEQDKPWQYEVLDKLRKEENIPNIDSVSKFALVATGETGFFYFLARSCHRHLCDDPEAKAKLAEAEAAMKGYGAGLPLLSPQKLMGVGGIVAATALVQAVPWLTAAASPFIAGFLVLIGSIGLETFCNWAANVPETRAKEN